jgi:1-acyl-sn-glycerol-3-phosphate acyltransferase
MWALPVAAGATIVLLVCWRRGGAGQTLGVYLGLILTRMYTGLWHRWSSNRPSPFPDKGPAIIVCNHTCSPDPMFVLSGGRRMISWIVARDHYNVSPITRWILDWMSCIAVTRNGRDAGAARTALRRLHEGKLVGVFPEGNLRGVARDRIRPGKHGVALLALRSRAPVFPVYIGGGPRTEKLLKAWLRPASRPAHVVYGRPVDLSAYYDRPIDRQLLEEVMALIMSRVAALRPSRRRRARAVPSQPGRRS